MKATLKIACFCSLFAVGIGCTSFLGQSSAVRSGLAVFRQKTSSADQLVVSQVDGQTMQVTDPQLIREFRSLIVPDSSRGVMGFSCMCKGSIKFEWSRGETLLLSATFHHGRTLRCRAAWSGDVYLTDDSSRDVCIWLADYGFIKPLLERGSRNRERLMKKQKQSAAEPKDAGDSEGAATDPFVTPDP